jgi:two-component system phosphate regulon response regulator PhoB
MSTVLVIDDDPDIRGLVEFKLSHAGMEVLSESNGEIGLAVAEELLPDLVLVDWMMPRLTGIEVCRRLRAGPRTAGILLILLTAKALDGDLKVGMAAGANDYILKPFSPRDLVTRVEAMLEHACCTLGGTDDA